MDDYYRSQISMPYFKGTSRQRGRGIGTFATLAGGVAMPLIKKYFIPTAKRVAVDLAKEIQHEAVDVLKGKTKPKQALKRAVKNTARRQLGAGKKRKIIRKRKVTRRSRKDILGKISI